MAARFKLPLFIRIGNAFTTLLLKRGVRMQTNVLLTVPGRKSGAPRTTPVTIIEHDGARYVQSPFGEVDWVRNVRAAGRATLTRGSDAEHVSAVEVSPEEAAPVIRSGLAIAPGMIRAYYDVTPDAPLAEFVREARRHPTFRLESAAPTGSAPGGVGHGSA